MLFCKPIRNKSRFKFQRKINRHFSFTEFEKAEFVIKKDWHSVIGDQSVFLNLSFLKLIEGSTHVKLSCRYILVYKDQVPAGVMYFQICDFNAGVFGNLLENELDELKSSKIKLFEKYINSKEKHDVFFKLLTCGNNLVSGEHGFYFSPSLSVKEKEDVICLILNTMISEEGLRGRISALLLKDFDNPIKLVEGKRFSGVEKFMVEPNMIVEFLEQLSNLDAYISSFSKKYRNRAKVILKKRAEFDIRELDFDEIHRYEKLIFQLYHNIFNKAKFKMLELPANYFSESKRIFDGKMIFKGVFYKNELVGFSTALILPGSELEAHYIGLNYDLNQELDLYQNILYGFLETAIELKIRRVNFGRTAAEIKSTIGAKAQDLICYIKPQNTVSKMVVKPFIDFLKPKPWIARNPFKEEN